MNKLSSPPPLGSYNYKFDIVPSDWNSTASGSVLLHQDKVAAAIHAPSDSATVAGNEADTTSANYRMALALAKDYHALGLQQADAITLIQSYLPTPNTVDVAALVGETYHQEIIFPSLYQGTMADYCIEKLQGRLYKVEKEDAFWYWNGKQWAVDLHTEVVKPMILDILRNQPGVHDKTLGPSFRKWVNTIYNIKGTTELVISQCPKIKAMAFNTDPLLFNLQNGVFCFKEMRLRQPKASEFLIHTAPFQYDIHAQCPHWEHFIHTITLGNQDLYEYLKMLTAYLLVGHNKLRLIFFLLGRGLNGKSTYAKTMQALLGTDYSSPFKDSTARAKKFLGKNDDLIPLINKRAYFLSEMDHDDVVDAALMKAISSGDSLLGRALWENYRMIMFIGKLLAETNALPRVTDMTDAYYDRLHIVPFDYRIEEDKKDISLLDKLKREIPGIFNWAVAGMQNAGDDWSHFRETVAMQQLKRDYRSQNDVVYQFLDHCYDYSQQEKTPTREIYADYNAYMKWHYPSTHTQANGFTLKAKFMAKGVRYLDSNGTWFYLVRKPAWENERQRLETM